MKTKGNWVIKYEDGFYYCGNNFFDKQLRKAQIYHWKEAAEEQAVSMRTRRYSKVADTKWEVIAVIPPQEQKAMEAVWQVSGAFDDFLKCSNCGESWPWATAAYFLFCPHCGKHMTNHQQED
jgi:Zn finger protein HypA/HybF involved in hydrogenase expression